MVTFLHCVMTVGLGASMPIGVTGLGDGDDEADIGRWTVYGVSIMALMIISGQHDDDIGSMMT